VGDYSGKFGGHCFLICGDDFIVQLVDLPQRVTASWAQSLIIVVRAHLTQK